MIGYILSQFRGRPFRSLAVAFGVALGAALFVALTALGTGYLQAARAPLAGMAADVVVTRPTQNSAAAASQQRTRGVRLPFDQALISQGQVTAIAHTQGVAAVAAGLQVWDFGATSYTTVLGLDPAQGGVGPSHALVQGLLSGRTLQPGDQGVAVADRHFAAFFSLKPGSSVTIGGQPFTVVGVAEQKGVSQGAVPNLYVSLADAQALAGLGPDQVDQVYVRVAQAADVDAIVAQLNRQIGPISATTEDSLLQVMGGIGRVSAQFATVAAAVGLAGGLVLAWLALSGLVAERRREIGVMKAVGWRAADVGRVFLLEALLLSLAGGLLGIGLGLGAAVLLGQLPLPEMATQATQALPGLNPAASGAGALTLPVQAAPTMLAVALLASIAGGVVGGWTSSRRAAALKPAQALR